MQQAVREIEAMSERLEASGMTQQQSKAAIAAIANSIERFAVTPERLRAEFERNYELLWKRIDERFNAVDERFKADDERFKSVDQRFDSVDQRFDSVDARFNSLEARLTTFEGAVDARFKSVEGRLDRIESLLEKMIGWMVTFFVTLIVGLMGLFGTLVVGIWPLA
ncbi:MAG: hypothetical protein OXJ53_07460 [Gammaproteobacteria bacterium]|nr:hypothetical protein [Gammaproteobacteria bacterium]MDE0272694.1 hypothetical protein [Gammaproteobacteria bacterium]